jgi:hypothetical protein
MGFTLLGLEHYPRLNYSLIRPVQPESRQSIRNRGSKFVKLKKAVFLTVFRPGHISFSRGIGGIGTTIPRARVRAGDRKEAPYRSRPWGGSDFPDSALK